MGDSKCCGHAHIVERKSDKKELMVLVGSDKKTVSILLLGAVFFLLVSLGLYSIAKTHCDIDSKAYIQRALVLYNNHSCAVKSGESLPYYAMGYPFFLCLIYIVFGVSEMAVVWVQILLALLCGFLLFHTTFRLFGRRVALVAFILYCTNLGTITFAQFLLTEVILATFLLLFFVYFISFVQRFSWLSLCAAGLCIGLSIIVKSAALFFVFCLLPLIMLSNAGASWSRRGVLSFLFLMSMGAPIVGYMAYNKVVFGSFSLGNMSEVNLYFWFFPNVLAQLHETNSDYERNVLQAIQEGFSSFKCVDDYFKTSLIHHSHIFLFVWMKNVVKTLLGLFTTNLRLLVDDRVHGGDVSFFKCKGNVWQKINSYLDGGASCWWLFYIAAAEALWTLVRWLFVVIALGKLLLARQFALVYFISCYIGYFSMITGHDGCARFRMMFEFVLIVMVAYGMVTAYDFFMSRRCRG